MSAATESAAEGRAPLDGVRRFAETLHRPSWFAALGQPAGAAEIAAARAYLAGLGLAGLEVAGLEVAGLEVDWVGDWRAAERVTRAPAEAWWQAEETARQALLATVRRATAEADYLAVMNRVVLAATEAVMGPAAVAAARDGIADPALIRVAAGAAAQACHQAALALAAGAPDDHPFQVKFRLYAGGRWPLGAVGARFFLF